MVNLELFIRSTDVKALLKQLVNSTTKLSVNNPLLYLSIVDDFIYKDSQTLSDESRVYAISAIVTDMIADEYNKYCDVHQISSIDRQDLGTVLRIIHTSNKRLSNLAGILVLYFSYVQYDDENTSNLITGAFSNFSRIREVGVNLLCNRLVEEEKASRKENYKRRLRQSLPNRGYVQGRLVERERDIENIYKTITKSKNILIKGAVGVGKSSILETVIDRIIVQTPSEIIILWLDLRDNGDIETCIREYYPYTKDFEALKKQIALEEVIMIADHANHNHISFLDTHFPLAKIIAISDQMLYEAHFWDQVCTISPLKPASVQTLISHIMTRYDGMSLDKSTVSHIVTASKGIPRNIISLVSHYCSEQITTTDYIDSYLALTRHAWLDVNAIVDFWSPDVLLDKILHHPHVEIIMMDGKFHARLREHVFVQFEYDFKQAVYKAVQRNRLLNNPIFPDVLYGLMRHDIEVDQFSMRHALDRYGWRIDQWVLWLQLALSQTNHPEIIVKLSRYHRLIGQPTQYKDDLERIKTFDAQIELVRCMKAIGQYRLAFEKIISLLNSRQNLLEHDEALLLLGQLHLDVGNLEEAHECLNQIQSLRDWSSYRLIYAELEMRMYGNTSIDFYKDHENVEPCMVESYYHYLTGFQNFSSNTELALEHFLRGLQLASQPSLTDKMIIGRYLSNIGACYAKLGLIDEARQYLNQACVMHQLIGDKVAMIYTQKNLDSLDEI